MAAAMVEVAVLLAAAQEREAMEVRLLLLF